MINNTTVIQYLMYNIYYLYVSVYANRQVKNKDLWIVRQGNFWDLNDKDHVHFSLYLYEDFY